MGMNTLLPAKGFRQAMAELIPSFRNVNGGERRGPCQTGGFHVRGKTSRRSLWGPRSLAGRTPQGFCQPVFTAISRGQALSALGKTSRRVPSVQRASILPANHFRHLLLHGDQAAFLTSMRFTLDFGKALRGIVMVRTPFLKTAWIWSWSTSSGRESTRRNAP